MFGLISGYGFIVGIEIMKGLLKVHKTSCLLPSHTGCKFFPCQSACYNDCSFSVNRLPLGRRSSMRNLSHKSDGMPPRLNWMIYSVKDFIQASPISTFLGEYIYLNLPQTL